MDTRRLVPRTDALLADPRLADAERRLGRALVKAAVSRAQQQARDGQIAPDQVADTAVAGLPAHAAALTPVINATGVLVHTNLGRAPLSAAAVEAVTAAAGSCDVEFDLVTGARARRGAGALDALARAVTAGHVDHGKSALVRALTGIEPDRWAEERRRGLTIDLGFAWMKLPGGQRLAFVDVPGHERFVPNMLAGVGPVPAVLIVVAADGGWSTWTGPGSPSGCLMTGAACG